MSSHPSDLRYTKTHQWVRARDEASTVGITEEAATELGAIGFVELPYAGERFKADEQLGSMSGESATAPITMPFACRIIFVNQALGDAPGLINSDPYDAGWIVRIEPNDPSQLDGLMDAAAYEAFLAAGGD